MNLCKRLLAGLLAAAAALSMTACGASSGDGSSAGSKTASASQTAQTRTDLNMALSVDPDGLDPQRTTAASTFQITNNIYDDAGKNRGFRPEGQHEHGRLHGASCGVHHQPASERLRKTA